MKNNSINTATFYKEVYAVVAQIPEGKVLSYGAIATLLGKSQHSRMVGRALKLVPQYLAVPCHRVVNSQGRLAPHWPDQKQRLMNEGVQFKDNGAVDMQNYNWNWEEI